MKKKCSQIQKKTCEKVETRFKKSLNKRSNKSKTQSKQTIHMSNSQTSFEKKNNKLTKTYTKKDQTSRTSCRTNYNTCQTVEQVLK